MNITFIDFAPQDKLEQRLSAADIHIVCLRAGYEGTVVPSKFQGALAAGRPILYAGPTHSAVAEWIDKYKLGWYLTPNNLDSIAQELVALKENQQAIQTLNAHCFEVYHQWFSRTSVIDRLDKNLKMLVDA